MSLDLKLSNTSDHQNGLTKLEASKSSVLASSLLSFHFNCIISFNLLLVFIVSPVKMTSISVFESIRALCENRDGLSESELIEQLNAIIDKDQVARSAIVNERSSWDWMTLLDHAGDNRSLEFCDVLSEFIMFA
jgi:hypothetical protein